jgi:5-methylcytosine-specific restriction endonuclease McrA
MSTDYSTIPTKTCTQCGETLPATLEYWHKTNSGKYGLRATCKKCRIEYQHQYYRSNRDEVLQQQRCYYTNNRDAIRARSRKWYENHAEEVRERSRRYYEDHTDEVIERSHRYYKANAENNRDARRQYGRRYRKSNPEKIRAKSAERRALKRSAEGSHTAAELQAQFKRQKGRCYWCGVKLPKQGYHADHVIPLVRGGSNYISNIVCACAVCNTSKQDKLPHEWEGTDRLL